MADGIGPSRWAAGSWRRLWLWGVLALVAMVTVESLYRAWREQRSGWGAARFVWAEEAPPGAARAFYLARDFRLSAAAARSAARLAVLCDEECLVHLNGVWVGAAVHRLGDAAIELDVSGLLRAGTNRVVLEARSATGAGGVLAGLFLEGEAGPVVATDGSWRVLGHHVDGLVHGTTRLDGGAAPRLLGRPPRGRWGVPPRGDLAPPARLEAAEAWAERADPVAGPAAEPGGRVQAVWRIDFGAEVEGFLELWSDLGACGCTLRFFSSEAELVEFHSRVPRTGAPKIRPHGAEPTSRPLILVPGAPRWRDVEPRRYRYVTLEAPDPPLAARVRTARAAPPRLAAPVGPFGLPPPPG